MKPFFLALSSLCALTLSPLLMTTAAHAQINCTGVAAWSPNSVAYAVGNLVTYTGSEYKCLQAHTSQSDWSPTAAASLWSDQGACATTTGSTTGTCAATPSAPSTPTASGTTSTGTGLSWTAVTPPTNCTISSYEVYENGTALASVTSGTSYTVSGLTASTTYKFTVAAVDADGTGTQSAAVSVTTLANACTSLPGTPATPTASGTTSSGTSLSWTAVTPPANCTISSYEVYKNGAALASASGTSYTVSGLTASTTYKFTVAAVDSDGTGTQSAAVSVITSAAPTCSAVPSAPATPTAANTSNTGTSLSWSAVTPPTNCTISSYEVYENGTPLASSTSTSYSVTGLTASTTYKFTVAAVDADGTGAQSASVSVVTTSGSLPTCGLAWSSATAYQTGNVVSLSGQNYQANYYSQGSSPATNSGPVGSGDPWIPEGACGYCSAVTSAPTGLAVSASTANSISLAWNAPTAPANCVITSYTIYANGTAYASGVTGTSYKISCLPPSTSYTFTIAATDGFGASAQSSGVNGSTTAGSASTCEAGSIGSPALIGYWESWGALSLATAATDYDVVAIAFALPGGTDGATVAMDTTTESAGQIAADIATLHNQGKKVIVSIGGANATNLELSNSTDVSNFVSSVEGILNTYGADGIDLDLENNTLQLNSGDNNYESPTTPSTVNLITALNDLHSHYGNSFIYTMAPQTADIDGFGHYGASGGVAWADFLPLIYNTRSILTYVMPQEYNSGQEYGLDGNVYTEATVDFNVAMTELLLHGFTLASPSTQSSFPAILQGQVVMGVPAVSAAAGSGYLAPSGVLSAVSYLMEGTADGGSYKLAGGPYPNLGGVMTWDCTYDYNAGDPMASVIAPYIHAH